MYESYKERHACISVEDMKHPCSQVQDIVSLPLELNESERALMILRRTYEDMSSQVASSWNGDFDSPWGGQASAGVA